jgi:hypothetical protein
MFPLKTEKKPSKQKNWLIAVTLTLTILGSVTAILINNEYQTWKVATNNQQLYNKAVEEWGEAVSSSPISAGFLFSESQNLATTSQERVLRVKEINSKMSTSGDKDLRIITDKQRAAGQEMVQIMEAETKISNLKFCIKDKFKLLNTGLAEVKAKDEELKSIEAAKIKEEGNIQKYKESLDLTNRVSQDFRNLADCFNAEGSPEAKELSSELENTSMSASKIAQIKGRMSESLQKDNLNELETIAKELQENKDSAQISTPSQEWRDKTVKFLNNRRENDSAKIKETQEKLIKDLDSYRKNKPLLSILPA